MNARVRTNLIFELVLAHVQHVSIRRYTHAGKQDST